MQARVIARAGSDPVEAERYTDERCYIREIWNDPSDPEVSLARARVTPGVVTAWHVLAVDERYVIESGEGRVEIADLPPRDVSPGDVVLIPSGTRQRVRNAGSEDLIFLCLCTPRFEEKHYRNLEDAG